MSEADVLDAFLDTFAEAMLVDFADTDDDVIVPIGLLLIEAFEAEERGYEIPEELWGLEMSTAEIRWRLRAIRERGSSFGSGPGARL